MTCLFLFDHRCTKFQGSGLCVYGRIVLMHYCFYWTYLSALPLALFASPLTDIASCPFFLRSVLWTPGNQPIFYHANNSCATNLLPSFSSLLPLPIQPPFSFLLAPGICISLCYPFPILSSHSLYIKGSIRPLPRLFSPSHNRGFISLFFPLFPSSFFLLSQ